MSLIIYILLLVLACLFPKSRKISFAFLILMWILYAFNTYSGDFIAYEYRYSIIQTQYQGVELGYMLLMKLCSKLGFSFTYFRMILATIYVSLLYRFINSKADYPALCLGFVFLVPFLHGISVIRSGIAGVIMLNGFFCLEEKSIKKKFLYVLWVLLAFLFHRSAILFLLFLLANRKPVYRKIIFIFPCIVTLFYIINCTTLLPGIAMLLFNNNEKVMKWLTTGDVMHPNMTGMLAMLLIVLVLVIIGHCFCREIIRSVNVHEQRKKEALLFNNIFSLSLLFIPLVLFADTYMRLYYMIYPLFVCLGLNCSAGKRKGFIEIYNLFIFTLILVIYMDHPYMGTQISMIGFFKYNSILG